MTDICDTIRMTSAATWTEIAGASSSGKTAITSGDRAYLDIQLQNWDADEATVELAITPDSGSPTSDEEFAKFILPAIASAVNTSMVLMERIYLPSDAHIWMKCDQTDTRALVNGYTETAS